MNAASSAVAPEGPLRRSAEGPRGGSGVSSSDRSRTHRASVCIWQGGRSHLRGSCLTARCSPIYVFVVPEFQGRGILKALMQAVLEQPELQALRVFLLATRDAHELYAQFGFRPLTEPTTRRTN
jgi:GNAT superfamily N-acetyltransferase